MKRPTDSDLNRLRDGWDELRFWEKVALPNERGCLLWTASITKCGGYGQFTATALRYGKQRITTAHRWAWERWRGQIPKGMHVCHVCDVPACCNVDHLFLGTPQDNADDKVSKGRSVSGERHHRAKLTDVMVAEIRMRAAAGETLCLIAKDMHVTPSLISMIVSNRIWRVSAVGVELT